MNEYIFKRIEKKYLMNKDVKDEFLKRVQDRLEKDKYFSSTICNIYFDTCDNDLIINSIEKPIFKEKVRLRSYFSPKMEEDVYLEVKTKYKGIVGKRRVKLMLSDFYDYLESGTFKDSQIMRELDYFFKYYDLKPSIFIGYDRNSYKSYEDDDLRITIDSNLRSRRENLKLDLGSSGEYYFNEDMYIMEIKTLEAMPEWLSRTLSDLKIFPVSFSKYGSIYMKEMEERVLC